MALVVQYKMQETSGTNVADSSGAARTAMLSADASGFTSVDGPGTAFPRSFNFDGVDDLFTMPGLAAQMGNDGTVCVWLKCASSSPAESASGLFHMGANVPNQASHYPYPGGGGYFAPFRATDNATINRVNNVNLSGGATRTNWHHFAITQSVGTNGWRLYQNNTLITQTTGVTPYWDDDIWVFGRSTGALLHYFYSGKACDFRIYNSNESANLAAIMAQKDLAFKTAWARGSNQMLGMN